MASTSGDNVQSGSLSLTFCRSRHVLLSSLMVFSTTHLKDNSVTHGASSPQKERLHDSPVHKRRAHSRHQCGGPKHRSNDNLSLSLPWEGRECGVPGVSSRETTRQNEQRSAPVKFLKSLSLTPLCGYPLHSKTPSVSRQPNEQHPLSFQERERVRSFGTNPVRHLADRDIGNPQMAQVGGRFAIPHQPS